MRRRWPTATAYLVSIVFFGFALLGLAGRAAETPGMRASIARTTPPFMYPLYLLLPRPQVTGFYENTASTPHGSGSYTSFTTHVKDVNVVSPLWFSIGPTGAIAHDRSQSQVVLAAKRGHVSLWPLVTNLGSSMLTNPGARAAAVRSLVQIGTRPGYAGVVVDFELLPPGARSGLSALISETALRLHRAGGRRLGVTVFPKVGVLGTLPAAYDYAQLGKSADQVILMAYDAHYDGGATGPVAPYPWVESNVLYMLRYVPKGHIYLGIGLYGYDWASPSGGAAATVSMTGAYLTAKSAGVPVHWMSDSGEATYTYTSGNTQHVVWFEAPRSVAEKASLARRYGLGGVGIWRLGYESPGTWTTVMQALKTGRTPAVPTGATQAVGGVFPTAPA